jgi:hypothetical protein
MVGCTLEFHLLVSGGVCSLHAADWEPVEAAALQHVRVCQQTSIHHGHLQVAAQCNSHHDDCAGDVLQVRNSRNSAADLSIQTV